MCSEVQKTKETKAGRAKLLASCEESCCREGLSVTKNMCNSNRKELKADTQVGVQPAQPSITSPILLSQHPATFSMRISLSLIWLA